MYDQITMDIFYESLKKLIFLKFKTFCSLCIKNIKVLFYN